MTTQQSLDSYLLSREQKKELEEQKVVEFLKELGGSVQISFHQKDQDSRALFGISFEELRAVILDLRKKGVIDYRTVDCHCSACKSKDWEHYLERRSTLRIFFAKRMRAAIAMPAIGV